MGIMVYYYCDECGSKIWDEDSFTNNIDDIGAYVHVPEVANNGNMYCDKCKAKMSMLEEDIRDYQDLQYKIAKNLI